MRSERLNVDQAALAGAATGAVIALVAGEGAYTWISSVVGVTLLLVLVAYWRWPMLKPDEPPRTPWKAVGPAAALGAVVGLCSALAVSAPLQKYYEDGDRLDQCDIPYGGDGPEAAVDGSYRRDAEASCVAGYITDTWMTVVALLAGVIVTVVATRRATTSTDEADWAPLIPKLVVSDFSVSMAFWTEKLGFEVMYRRTDPDFVMLRLGRAQVILEARHDSSWLTGSMERPYGRGINLEIEHPAPRGLAEHLERLDINPYLPLLESTYAVAGVDIVQLAVVVQDPDGYLLRFAHHVTPAKRNT